MNDNRSVVVIVDDDKMVLKALVRSLTGVVDDNVLQVWSFNDPTVALDWIINNSVDVVVSDFDMPGMNGAELFEAVHREQGKDCPAWMFISGRNTRAMFTCSQKFGIRILRKPDHILELASAVVALLS